MARKLELSEEVDIILVTKVEETLTTDAISIDKIEDDGESVKVNISFFSPTGTTKILTLWEDEEYTKIDQWTDTDVNERIKQLLNIK